MNELERMRDIIQEDVGHRGLRTDPVQNLVNAFPADFEAACRSLADIRDPVVGIVTGFYIPHATPPCGETDGPLGAVFLARALAPLGFRIVLMADAFCTRALEVGLTVCRLANRVAVVALPPDKSIVSVLEHRVPASGATALAEPLTSWPAFTHLIALERCGPSHTEVSMQSQPGVDSAPVEWFKNEITAEHYDRCHTMRGRDITAHMAPAHLLFEAPAGTARNWTTIGIGDGGNEIGMGKIPWHVVRRNIPNGGLVACRVPTDHLVVCGVSNWGAYGLAAGVRHLRGAKSDRALFDPEREAEILRAMVADGPLVDGVSGKPTATVDGLTFERYGRCLTDLAREDQST